MKLIYKGVYKNKEQLPKGMLPSNAVKFKEPETMGKLNLVASLISIPVLFIACIFLIAHALLHGDIKLKFTLIGFLLSFLTLLPHEFLHAVCFGKDAEVELYVAPKQLMAFVISVQPITKTRFIGLSLLPNLVFGWCPLMVWTILPYSEIYSNHLFTFSFISILFGVGDYLNVFNAIRQMPKGSMQQISGFNSYWFMP